MVCLAATRASAAAQTSWSFVASQHEADQNKPLGSQTRRRAAGRLSMKRFGRPFPRGQHGVTLQICADGRATRRWSSSSSSSRPERPKTAMFFPGQGVQKVGMLTPWLEAFPSTAAQLVDEMDTHMGFRLSEVIQKGPSGSLTQTALAQPAIMATSVLILRIVEREFGLRTAERIDFTLGHSLGEFAALVAGGYVSFGDSLGMVRRRAEAMAEATRRAVRERGGEYGMVAVITEPEYLGALISAIHEFQGPSREDEGSHEEGRWGREEQVSIANINSRNQIVLSGSIERIGTLVAHVRQFLGHDPRAVRLRSDSPFHSPVMRPAVDVMLALLGGREMIAFPGVMPCVSNVTARPFGSREELKDLLARGCLETVRWWDAIKYLDREERVRRWVGIGPGKVGRNLVGKEVGMRGKDLVKGGGVWAITDPTEVEEVLRGLEETDQWEEEEEE